MCGGGYRVSILAQCLSRTSPSSVKAYKKMRRILVCGGGYLCVEEDACVWRRILMCGGGYLCVDEDTCVWRRILVCGGGYL